MCTTAVLSAISRIWFKIYGSSPLTEPFIWNSLPPDISHSWRSSVVLGSRFFRVGSMMPYIGTPDCRTVWPMAW